MPLTVFEIDAAKPGLRPVRQGKEGLEADAPFNVKATAKIPTGGKAV